MTYQLPQFLILSSRLDEPRRFIQVVAGPRQVGKTTLVQQVCEARASRGQALQTTFKFTNTS